MADQRIIYNEYMVGANHPTKADTLNRLSNVEHNTDGTHKMTSGAAGVLYYHDGTKMVALPAGATTKLLVGGGAAAPVWTVATGSGAPVRATSPDLITPTRTTEPADNDSSLALATTAFAKSEDAVLHRGPDQGVALTAAASGSSGITVADNDNIDFGTGNFALVWKGSLPDWTPSGAVQRLIFKSSTYGYRFFIDFATPGRLSMSLIGATGGVTYYAGVNTFIDGTVHEVAAVVTKETVSADGSILFYADGVYFATSVITANTIGNINDSSSLLLLGEGAARIAGTLHSAYLINFAPTAAEVLDMHRNGIPLKWFDPTGVSPASQTAQTSGSLVVGKEYVIDDWISDDDFANVGGANVDGTRFVATGVTPTKWLASSSLRRIGATLKIESEDMQPAPGQCLDSSGNNLHALQPATGSNLTRPKRTFTTKWVNTWAGTHAAQYIGGINQAILPLNCYIDSIIGVVTGGTIEDIIVGDGSDTDRWVEVTTGLAAGTTEFTIPAGHRISDGTNRKMVVDPDANFTGSISWTINGRIL